MMAIFHGTSWLTFSECTCLFGFYSIASREWEKDMVSSLFQRLDWEMVSHQRFFLIGMTLISSQSFAIERTITKALSWILKALALTTNTKAVPNCTCCHRLLLCQTLLGINHLLGLWGSFLVLFAIGISLKLKSVPLRQEALCVYCREWHYHTFIQLLLSTNILCSRVNYFSTSVVQFLVLAFVCIEHLCCRSLWARSWECSGTYYMFRIIRIPDIDVSFKKIKQGAGIKMAYLRGRGKSSVAGSGQGKEQVEMQPAMWTGARSQRMSKGIIRYCILLEL